MNGVIGDFFEVKGGKRLPKGSKFSDKKTSYPYLRVKDFKRNGLKKEDIRYIDASIQEKIKRYIINANQVYISIAGTIGVAGIVPNEFDKANLTENAAKFTPKQGTDVYPKYLSYYLNSARVQSIIRSKTMAVGVPKLALFRIQEIPIILPPLAEQKKIVAILDEADKVRQLNRALLAEYDALSQSLFLDMFGDPVTNPKGWEVKNIEELVKREKWSIKRGPFGGALKKEIFVEKGYLVYEQYHALNNDFSMVRYFIDDEKFEELKAFEVKEDDIIISCSGVNLGRLAIVPKGARKGIINQALLKLTLDENIMTNILFINIFTSKNFKAEFFGERRGSGVPNFPPMSAFRRFQFICPPLPLQTEFAHRIAAIEAQKAQAAAALSESEDLFGCLLQNLF